VHRFSASQFGLTNSIGLPAFFSAIRSPEAELSTGIPETVGRTVTENSQTLKFFQTKVLKKIKSQDVPWISINTNVASRHSSAASHSVALTVSH